MLTIPDVQEIDIGTEGGRFVVHYEGMCQSIQAARPISKRLILSKRERHSVSNQYLSLQVDMGAAANLPRAQGPAPRAGRPRPV